MFRPAALFIGLRYTRAKRRNHFISFISVVSMLGIALGITVLITVLSVMNGFDREIQNRVFSMVSPITISSTSGAVADWQSLQMQMKDNPAITGSAPYVSGEVLVSNGNSVQPVILSGILPDQEKNVSEIAKMMVEGNLNQLQPGKFGIIIGETLAYSLDAKVGDKITVITPQVTLSPAGVTPRFKRFTLVGIFRAGNGFNFDRGLGFISLNDGQRLFGLGSNVTGIHLNTQDPLTAATVAKSLSTELSASASITTWADTFGEFFRAIQLEKTMMFLILLLILAVAAFNLVSTLIMVVNEKESNIAILRTFGATPRTIMGVFIVQGAIIGVLGTLLGVLGGVLLASNVTVIVHWIERVFHVQFLSANVYFVNYLPSEIEWSDLVKICLASLGLSLIATIYPSWRASKTDPVESLRYE